MPRFTWGKKYMVDLNIVFQTNEVCFHTALQ